VTQEELATVVTALVTEILAGYDVKYTATPDWMTQRVLRGIEDDLEDLIAGGKIERRTR
jgi:hypothetical protein